MIIKLLRSKFPIWGMRFLRNFKCSILVGILQHNLQFPTYDFFKYIIFYTIFYWGYFRILCLELLH